MKFDFEALKNDLCNQAKACDSSEQHALIAFLHAQVRRYDRAEKALGLSLDSFSQTSPNDKGQPAATEPAKQARRGPLGCADLLGAEHLPEWCHDPNQH